MSYKYCSHENILSLGHKSFIAKEKTWWLGEPIHHGTMARQNFSDQVPQTVADWQAFVNDAIANYYQLIVIYLTGYESIVSGTIGKKDCDWIPRAIPPQGWDICSY